MTTYVGPVRTVQHPRLWKCCHLFADTFIELMEFAEELGLEPDWLHRPKQDRKVPFVLHFDISPRMRAQALRLGAVDLGSMKEEGKVIKRLRRDVAEKLDGLTSKGETT